MSTNINIARQTKFFLLFCFFFSFAGTAQVGIGTTSPDPSAILDVTSKTQGMLLPRMTTDERNAITTPATGLQIYNETTNTSDIFINGIWNSFAFSRSNLSNLVYVYSLADLPTPVAAEIILDSNKMYVFSGAVTISPNFINVNGAGLRGTDPQKDMIISNVAGGILRSTDKSLFIQDLAIGLAGRGTKAFDVSDSSGQHYFNSFSGTSVIELVEPSAGVGQISGFKAITFIKNFWKVSNGVKVTGTVGKFTGALNFVEEIKSGNAAIEFLSGVNILDIDLSNNYFIYDGGTGIKVNAGATIDRGRMTTNMFRGVTTLLDGIDSYSNGWSMQQNTNIPDSRAFGFVFFQNNTTATAIPNPNEFVKIAGTTTTVSQKRFTAAPNSLKYNDVVPITAKVFVVISGKAPLNGADFSICLAKNGVPITINAPIGSMGTSINNQSFQIVLNTEVEMITNDFIEVFISRVGGSNSFTVEGLQFRVTD